MYMKSNNVQYTMDLSVQLVIILFTFINDFWAAYLKNSAPFKIKQNATKDEKRLHN